MATRPVSTSKRKTTLPQFKEGMLYKWWKNKIQTWQLVIKISIDKKEQAIVALLEPLKNNTKVKKATSEFIAA